MPSYTFVSTANAFALRGATIVFADSRKDHPGIDESLIESLITDKTKAIVPVHYAGVACDMEMLMEISEKHGIYLIEDAAQAIDSYFIDKQGNKKPLGSIGHLATFSFHETKNIISGEGGLLAINDSELKNRAELLFFEEKSINMAGSILALHSYHRKLPLRFYFLSLNLWKKFKHAEKISVNFIKIDLP